MPAIGCFAFHSSILSRLKTTFSFLERINSHFVGQPIRYQGHKNTYTPTSPTSDLNSRKPNKTERRKIKPNRMPAINAQCWKLCANSFSFDGKSHLIKAASITFSGSDISRLFIYACRSTFIAHGFTFNSLNITHVASVLVVAVIGFLS